MAGHADTLDQRERLTAPFWGSMALHAGVAAAIVTFSIVHPLGTEHWGDPNGGRLGSVAVSAVSSIPLPNRGGPKNPLANDTESQVPSPPPKVKARPKVQTPPPDAIPIKTRNAQKKYAESAAAQPNKWREKQVDRPNQLYTPGGQSLSSEMYEMRGGGGVGVGTNSPFGTQFGYYANLLRDQVARAWKTTDVDPRLNTAPQVAVRFSIVRDGSLLQGSVKISQSSGNQALDFSAMRAVLDAGKFPPLPAQFNRDRADLELRFELRR
jgi:periplasmic protein TonB